MSNFKSVLLVEDDTDDQEFFIEAISKIENAVMFDIANNGEEALTKLDNPLFFPDLIFMDIHMPVMDGIKCLTEIVKNPHTNHIPVVMLTTDTEQSDLVRQLGARAFLKKPNNSGILHDQVKKMINLDFIEDGYLATRTFETVSSDFMF